MKTTNALLTLLVTVFAFIQLMPRVKTVFLSGQGASLFQNCQPDLAPHGCTCLYRAA
jgi:hypothetical protein